MSIRARGRMETGEFESFRLPRRDEEKRKSEKGMYVAFMRVQMKIAESFARVFALTIIILST